MPKDTFFNLRDKRKQHLTELAMEVFISKPYSEIKRNDLLEAMDLPAGTFHNYFEDKEDLYTYVLSTVQIKRLEPGSMVFKLFNPNADDTYNLNDKEKAMSATLLDMPGEVAFRYIFSYYVEAYTPVFKEGLQKQINQGLYRQDLDLDLASFYYLTSGFLRALYAKKHGIEADTREMDELNRKVNEGLKKVFQD